MSAKLLCGSLLVLLALVAGAQAGPLDTAHANNGAIRAYSIWENGKFTMWNLYVRPSITAAVAARGIAQPEPGFGNAVRAPLGHVLGAGSHRNEGLFIVWDMLVQEFVPHLLYLDPQDAVLSEEVFHEPLDRDQEILGTLRLDPGDTRVFLSPAVRPVPEPTAAVSLLMGLGALMLLGLRRERRQRSAA